MNLNEFINDALRYPSDGVSYFVSRQLGEFLPEREIVEGRDSRFDLRKFSEAGECEIVLDPRVHNQQQTVWKGDDEPLERQYTNVWLQVLWRGQLLDVLLLTLSDGWCRRTFHWIVADERQVAERFFEAVCKWNATIRSEILVFTDGCWEKNTKLYDEIRGATFENLVLPEAFVNEIREDCGRFFSSQELYDRYGVPWRRGVLFVGPPGNGKTHAVKALVNDQAKACLYVKSFESEYETDQENIQAVFERARRAAPCILVLEDLDALVTKQSRSYFLNELDGFARNSGIFAIGTTNYPERLDSAIADRPSRFDRTWRFQIPDADERLAFVETWNTSLEPEARLSPEGTRRLADASEGFSFAYLKELFVSSLLAWVGTAEAGRMDEVAFATYEALRSQSKGGKKEKKRTKKQKRSKR